MSTAIDAYFSIDRLHSELAKTESDPVAFTEANRRVELLKDLLSLSAIYLWAVVHHRDRKIFAIYEYPYLGIPNALNVSNGVLYQIEQDVLEQNARSEGDEVCFHRQRNERPFKLIVERELIDAELDKLAGRNLVNFEGNDWSIKRVEHQYVDDRVRVIDFFTDGDQCLG